MNLAQLLRHLIDAVPLQLNDQEARLMYALANTGDGGGVLVFRSGCLAGDLLAALFIIRAQSALSAGMLTAEGSFRVKD